MPSTPPNHKFAIEKTAEKLIPLGANLPLFQALYITASTGAVPANRRFHVEGQLAIDMDTGFFVSTGASRISTGKLTTFETKVDPRISTQSQVKIF